MRKTTNTDPLSGKVIEDCYKLLGKEATLGLLDDRFSSLFVGAIVHYHVGAGVGQGHGDSAADAGPDIEVGEMVYSDPSAPACLRKSHEVHVVVNECGGGDRLLEADDRLLVIEAIEPDEAAIDPQLSFR